LVVTHVNRASKHSRARIANAADHGICALFDRFIWQTKNILTLAVKSVILKVELIKMKEVKI
jgi:hypothetical protein